MRAVKRTTTPASLRLNGKQWTRELMTALRAEHVSRAVLLKLFSRYDRRDVRDALQQMYAGLCCYCEAEIGVVAFEHIEHRRPKSQFPEKTYAWDNLHLGCPKCNQSKGKKWDARAPILDAGIDNIDDHLTYALREVVGAVRLAKTPRADTTVRHTDLNRDKLRNTRTKVAFGVFRVIAEFNLAPNSPQRSVLLLELKEKQNGEYGSMVKWLVDTFLRAA